MGTPRIARPSLSALWQTEDVVLAVTQPDKRSGRGRRVTISPVKEEALERGIPLIQPRKVSDRDVIQAIRETACDLIVVVAFGQILPPELLEVPRFGCINLHASLLPKYRGASPIAMAIVQGEKETGVTTMMMDRGMDTGDILLQNRLRISGTETAGELTERLSILGVRTLLATLKALRKGQLKRIPQDEEEATYTPLLKKQHGEIAWDRTSSEIRNHVRGMDPWPGAYTFLQGEMLKIWRVSPSDETGYPGEVLLAHRHLVVGCGGGSVIIEELQLPGKRRMRGEEFLRGHPDIQKGMILGKAK